MLLDRRIDPGTPVYGVWSEKSLIVHRRSETRRGFTDCGIDHRNMTEVRFTTGRPCRRCAEIARKRGAGEQARQHDGAGAAGLADAQNESVCDA